MSVDIFMGQALMSILKSISEVPSEGLWITYDYVTVE